MSRIIPCTQLSPEWFELRRGRPTASQFDRIMTPKTMKLAAAHDDYINELIAETFHPGPLTDLAIAPSRAMQRGTDCEPEARAFYAMQSGVDVVQVGLVETDDGRFACSPDGLVGDDGCLELKCPSGKVHVGYLRDWDLPAEYRCQVHGQLIVTGRDWVDFLSYYSGSPSQFLIRVVPDRFTVALRGVLDEFWDKYQKALDYVRDLAGYEPWTRYANRYCEIPQDDPIRLLLTQNQT